MKVGYVLIFVGTLVAFCYGAENEGKSPLKDLGIVSKNSIVPTRNNATTVSVGLVLQYYNLNERENLLESLVWLNIVWKDEKLQWKPNDYDGLESMTVPIDQIWSPDILCYNGLNVGDMALKSKYQVGALLNYNGTVSLVAPYRLKTTCQIDMSEYPYDTQKCMLKFGSWTQDGNKINLELKEAGPDISTLSTNPNWDLASVSSQRNVFKYESVPELYYELEFTLELKRNAAGIGFMYTAPGVFLFMLIPLFFLLPPDTNEKTIFGAALLITTGAIMASFPNVVNVESSNPPILLQYYTGMLVMTAIALAITHVLAALIRMDFQCKLPPLCTRICTCLLCAGEKMPSTEDERAEDEKDAGEAKTRSDWRLFIILLDRVLFVASVVLVIITMLSMLT